MKILWWVSWASLLSRADATVLTTNEAFEQLVQLPLATLNALHRDIVLQHPKQDTGVTSLPRTSLQNPSPQQVGGRSLLQFYVTGQTGLWDVKKRSVGVPDAGILPVNFQSSLFGTFSSQLTQGLPTPARKATPGSAGNFDPPNDELVRDTLLKMRFSPTVTPCLWLTACICVLILGSP